jgi:serine/threonine protein kinase
VQISNPGHLFALKRLNTHDDRELWQEVDILKRFRNVDHIIQLLATFEVNEGSLSSYYLLFPWATGDLELLWEAKHSYVGDYRIAPWIAKQCYGLARALSSIHNDDDDHNPVDTDHLYGRHGDIKPSNILWFSPSPSEINVDFGQLVMGDFGLGDFRSDHSRSGLDASAFARSPKYRAPEFDIGGRNISRKVDIWTLGCTHLEFVTWYLMGNEAVTDKFREARSEPDIYGIYADTFFRIVGGDNGSVGIIKPQATAWITSLHEHRSCSDYIHDFLELIEHHMLVADPKGRLTAAALSGKMKEMYSRCQDNPQYYQVGKPRPGNAQPEESVSCHVISGSGDATGNIQRKKGNIMTMVRNVLRHSKASDRNVP